METEKKPPIGEVHVSGDIFLTLEQLNAILWFYGKNATLSDVITSITAMPEEARENFMDQLVLRHQNPDKPPQE
ncbi:hypothetical protein IPM65_04875 [Candidatus Roizmanbacteria bacterium]|nr:MAG: hypothetical protein IPM65_04875 [Candidatus Roizmanbacteria bacterium]